MSEINVDRIIENLKAAEKPVAEEVEKERKIIELEVKQLGKFVSRIQQFATRKEILGRECILIYVFDSSRNDTISNDVYISSDGFVRYQVYDEETYRGFVPDAIFEGGYVTIRADHFLENVPLYKIMEFFEKRPEALKLKEFDISERSDRREKFLKELK